MNDHHFDGPALAGLRAVDRGKNWTSCTAYRIWPSAFNFVWIAIVLLASNVVNAASERGLDAVDDRPQAPPLVLQNLDNDVFDISQTGRVVLVNFWAVWCAPCRAEMPSMQLLYDQFDRSEFEIVAVDMGSKRKHIDEFLDQIELPLNFQIVMDDTGAVASDWGVRGIPVSFVIDADGNIAYKAIGERDWSSESIREEIRALVDEQQ